MVNCKSGKVKNPATGRCVNKNSPVLKKVPTVKVVGPVGPQKLIQTCGPNLYINPKTRRCVQLKNADIQKHLKLGYVLDVQQGPQGPQGPIVPPVKLDKVPINNPQNVNDPDIKILVPPDTQNYVKLVYCGKDKVINPNTGRCINLSGPIGKKLTSKPYIIINPPSGPQKSPYFAKPSGPQTGPPKVPQKVPQKVPKLGPLTSLDTDGDNYISVREYLDAVESLGPKEKSSGKNFYFYNQRDLGIAFILTLIKNQRGPIHKIGCIPLFHLCVYKNPSSKDYYTMQNIRNYRNRLDCPYSDNYYSGSSTGTYASIVILNAPLNNSKLSKNVIDKMKILIPPNLKQLINNCENDDKYMVVCDLTLLMGDDFLDTSHANVLIFDIRRKTIERFDPHGGNFYSDVKLAYDPNSEDIIGKKDFKNLNFGDSYIKSQALHNQIIIDNQLKEKFMEILPDYRYYGTNYTTPYLGPQVKADAYDGLCVTWSCMYMVLRLLNPDLSPADITMNMINGTSKELLNRILRFQKFIIRTLSKEKNYIK